MRAQDLVLFADYFQFYVMDAQCPGPRPERWTTDHLMQKVICGGDHLVAFTARNMEVPVRIEILPEAPPLELEGWDHMVDGALRLTSGQILVLGCTDAVQDGTQLPMAAGSYRVRVCMAGLDSLSEDGLDGEDRYRVQIWPGRWRDTVVRQMHASAA